VNLKTYYDEHKGKMLILLELLDPDFDELEQEVFADWQNAWAQPEHVQISDKLLALGALAKRIEDNA
jgi:hypothetical protein